MKNSLFVLQDLFSVRFHGFQDGKKNKKRKCWSFHIFFKFPCKIATQLKSKSKLSTYNNKLHWKGNIWSLFTLQVIQITLNFVSGSNFSNAHDLVFRYGCSRFGLCLWNKCFLLRIHSKIRIPLQINCYALRNVYFC